ncbi:hypothetical protein [Vibrio hippocampi]|uniref:Uncharacterized protein n=1 Tax=Vibrio hippocampi TaxID=654686 RepID=A0ABM8ZLQ8_9VIBR|nr:hypothetical protein [Vibrio hippocampi]CAH0529383.1 hypothetical protein VHP8226_03192 [Vibrio hippocampi]
MAQAMQMNTIAVAPSMEKKAYSVNLKGLIAHFMDILFGKDEVQHSLYSSDLSAHLQRDIGIR